jgi:hypothetical protein
MNNIVPFESISTLQCPPSVESGHRFVFVCGLHRSGTSFLFRMLRQHPSISGFRNTGVPEDEGQHLQTVFPRGRQYGGPGKFGFADEAHLCEDSPLACSVNRARLLEEWGQHWDLSKPILLEKSPPNLIRTRFLQKLFPNSFFLIILRHPIAVSLATEAWSHTGLESLMRHWVQCHDLWEGDRPHLRRVMTLRYEDLVAQPDVALARVCRFLGLPPIRCDIPVLTNTNDKYFQMWREWATRSEDRILMERILQQHDAAVKRFGYNLRVRGVPVPERRIP